jgi:CBS domain-containing protein
MSLQRFCQRPIVTVAPEHTIATACQLLEDHNIGCLLVEEQGKLCGILTDRDVALRVTGHRRDPEQTTVRQVMSGNPVAISVESTVHALTALMQTRRVRRVPIIDETGRAIGIVTLDDLLALLGDEMSDMGQAISDAFFRKPPAAEDETEEFHWWVLP